MEKLDRFFVLSLALLVSFCAGADAQTFPVKPIRLIVAFPAGGPSDVAARILGQKLSARLGQPVVVENRGGANGVIGYDAVAKAPGDGYTVGMVTIGFATNPAMNQKAPFDYAKDFAPVIKAYSNPAVFVVNPKVLPVSTLQDFIVTAKARPGTIHYTSPAYGSSGHLAMEMLKRITPFEADHVTYKGAAPAMNDVLSGNVQLMASDFPTAITQIRAGRVRPLAVSSARRSVLLPDVPTIAESGFPGFDVSTWGGVVAPAQTPKPIVRQLNAELTRIIESADTRDRFLNIGLEPATSTPEEFAQFIASETASFRKLIQDIGLKAE